MPWGLDHVPLFVCTSSEHFPACFSKERSVLCGLLFEGRIDFVAYFTAMDMKELTLTQRYSTLEWLLISVAVLFIYVSFARSPSCLFSSISKVSLVSIYRLTLHPLAKFPGPFFSKISEWSIVPQARSGDRHIESWKEHEKYGMWTHL